MRIVTSVWGLTGFGGTESYTLTVASELERLGHDVWIYAPEIGASGEHARARGMRVIDEESRLPGECQAVLAQDAATAYHMAGRYPEAVRGDGGSLGRLPVASTAAVARCVPGGVGDERPAAAA